MHKPAHTEVPIHPLIASRWSPRAFDTTHTISPQTALALKEAARWAPSCYGAQPWRFVVCCKNDTKDAFEALLPCLAEGNQAWAKYAPMLVLVCAEKNFSHNGKPNRHYQYDTGAAAMSFVLEAENHGLRCHQMGGFSPEDAAKALGVPDDFECISVIAVGLQFRAEHLPEELQVREKDERTRRSLAECFFDGAWGKTNQGGQKG